jgi:16S rRNA (uracil1498-N3)-methyltransferase
MQLEEAQAHHICRVLRLAAGDQIELFDSAGNTARATLLNSQGEVQVETIDPPSKSVGQFSVASAIPKGERGDWMVEKLSELGAEALIPLRTARSVVHPQGSTKFQRWERLARESARQSHRRGIMHIAPLQTPAEALAGDFDLRIVLHPGSPPLSQFLLARKSVLLIIGPEGGWSEEELRNLQAAGASCAGLVQSVLRVETAALCAAAIVAALQSVPGDMSI